MFVTEVWDQHLSTIQVTMKTQHSRSETAILWAHSFTLGWMNHLISHDFHKWGIYRYIQNTDIYRVLLSDWWRRQWHPTPVLLPGKSHGRRSLVGCGPWVEKSRTRLIDFTFTFHFHAVEKAMATHSSVLAWRIPGMEEPHGLRSMGSHGVGHDWSDLAPAGALSDWTELNRYLNETNYIKHLAPCRAHKKYLKTSLSTL